jgi:hypothetical protein
LIQNNKNDVAFNPAYGPVLSQHEAAAYLARALILAWASGVRRFYWYAWDNSRMGLVEPDRKTLKPPARAYNEVENWLLGAIMKSCASDEEGTWTCELSRGNTYRAWIVWNPSATERLTAPGDWQAMQVRELSGTVRKLSVSTSIEIGPAPVLIENRIP